MKTSRRMVTILAISVLVQPMLGIVASAQTDQAPFSGSASALGIHIRAVVPGGPGTDVPADGGGPTAQASLDSLGTSKGYAALPDPGEFIVSIPGLAAGLIASGLPGLPPIDLPQVPEYPLYVTSDAQTRPESSVGSGPYVLVAQSSESRSTAKAQTGLENVLVGNTALVTSRADTRTENGTAIAEAVTNVEGLTIGPLTIGQITTRAKMTQVGTRQPTPSTDISISGARVGSVPVEITADGLDVGGAAVPLPIQSTVESLIEPLGIQLEITPATELEDGVSSPALRITAPFDTFGLGTDQGTMTVTVGSTTARMASYEALPDLPPPADDGTTPAGGIGQTPIPSTPTEIGGDSAAPVASPGTASEPTVAPGPGGDARPVVDVAGEPLTSRLNFDLMPLYLTAAAAALGWVVLNQIIRLLGVRGRWT